MGLHKPKKIIFVFLVGFILIAVFYFEAQNITQEPLGGLIDEIKPADCGVVLTGAPGRVREAFEVLNLHKINKLIISGVYKDTQLKEIFPHINYYPEVNPEDVILEKISNSTVSNALQSSLVVETLRCRSVLLMTSQLHMSRAYRIFKAQYPNSIDLRKFSIVNSQKEESFSALFFETIKSIFYYLLV